MSENKKDKTVEKIIKTAAVLVVICAVVALVLSVVNKYTKDIIAQNDIKAQEKAIKDIFVSATEINQISPDISIEVNSMYEVKNGSELVGYAVNISPVGFGGEISMMVGVSNSLVCQGVKIISLSETPGLGANVKNDDFLSQYDGKVHGMEVKKDIEAVAGATISSKAVTLGVNNAISAVSELSGASLETTANETQDTEEAQTTLETIGTDTMESEPETTALDTTTADTVSDTDIKEPLENTEVSEDE